MRKATRILIVPLLFFVSHCFFFVFSSNAKKGDVLGTARIAGHHGGEAHLGPDPLCTAGLS